MNLDYIKSLFDNKADIIYQEITYRLNLCYLNINFDCLKQLKEDFEIILVENKIDINYKYIFYAISKKNKKILAVKYLNYNFIDNILKFNESETNIKKEN